MDYKDIIILILIVVPYIVFVRNTIIDRSQETLRQALIAVGVGWALVVISSFIISGVDYLLASSEFQKQQITNNLLDKHMFAAVVGWVFPALVIFIAWLLHLLYNNLRRKWLLMNVAE